MFRLVPVVFTSIFLTVSGHSAIVLSAKHERFPGASIGSITTGMGTDGPVFDNRSAQIFMALTGGSLEDVSFAAYANNVWNPVTAPLRIDVTSLIGGKPGDILATEYVPVSQFPTTMPSDGLNITVSFADSGVELVTGRSYALVFRTDTVEANYQIGQGSYPGYFYGSMMRSSNSPTYTSAGDGDIYFQVRVDTVPEPSALAVMGMGCAAVFGTRRRRTRCDL